MKIAFIIPYFGKFNNYFQLFLNSCKKNANVDWLIFTDDHTAYKFPDNVKVYYSTFEAIREEFQKKFDFKLALNTPYKLCDLKPAYGYLFEKYIQQYDVWGYCDTDLIWGDFSEFITPALLQKYEKIGDLGHCTLIKNSYDNNRAFMLPLRGEKVYRRVFSDSNNNSFDEEYGSSINDIFEEHALSIYPSGEMIANVYTKSSNFRLTFMNKKGHYKIERRSKSFFAWQDGKLVRFEQVGNQIKHQDYLYIHMQSRRMRVCVKNSSSFKIIPNSFDPLKTTNIDINNFPKVKHFNLHYFRIRSHNLYIKLSNALQR